MTILFRCDCCWWEKELSCGHEGDDLSRTCEDCGQDGCAECLTGDLCSECLHLRERADAEDLDNAGVAEDTE